MADKLLLTANEAASRLSMSRSFFYSHIVATGKIQKIKFGRKTLFVNSDLVKFVEGLTK